MSASVEQRRAARNQLREQRRRRRYALIDALTGVAIAIVGFIIAPGIGIVFLAALAVLAVCGGSLLTRRSRGRRRRHRVQSTHDPDTRSPPLAPSGSTRV